jgi:hypothetical protein
MAALVSSEFHFQSLLLGVTPTEAWSRWPSASVSKRAKRLRTDSE